MTEMVCSIAALIILHALYIPPAIHTKPDTLCATKPEILFARYTRLRVDLPFWFEASNIVAILL
jgi:hypothetical protein